MGDKTAIGWTEATWNPLLGCTKVSPGCEHCYAIKRAYRNSFLPGSKAAYAGLTRKFPDGSINWTGAVRQMPERLEQPIRWTKPRMIFVDSMSDLFHPVVSDRFIAEVFAVMAVCQDHTFQLLTKRPERMQHLLNSQSFQELVSECMAIRAEPRGWRIDSLDATDWGWPLPNLWVITSTENQKEYDERIGPLLATTAAVHGISAEPLLGPLDISIYRQLRRDSDLDWVITGGLSGGPDVEKLVEHRAPQAGEFDPDPVVYGNLPGVGRVQVVSNFGIDHGNRWMPKAEGHQWVAQLRDQCSEYGIPFYFKQWGGPVHSSGGRMLDGREWNEYPTPVTRP